VGVLLFLNVFAVLFFCGRRLFLSDTGRELAHVEKQAPAEAPAAGAPPTIPITWSGSDDL
jgi:hypothetical protein